MHSSAAKNFAVLKYATRQKIKDEQESVEKGLKAITVYFAYRDFENPQECFF